MAIEDPGEFTVTCDVCEKKKDFESTEYTDNTFGVSEETLNSKGWDIVNGEILCKECVKAAEKEREDEDYEIDEDEDDEDEEIDEDE